MNTQTGRDRPHPDQNSQKHTENKNPSHCSKRKQAPNPPVSQPPQEPSQRNDSYQPDQSLSQKASDLPHRSPLGMKHRELSPQESSQLPPPLPTTPPPPPPPPPKSSPPQPPPESPPLPPPESSSPPPPKSSPPPPPKSSPPSPPPPPPPPRHESLQPSLQDQSLPQLRALPPSPTSPMPSEDQSPPHQDPTALQDPPLSPRDPPSSHQDLTASQELIESQELPRSPRQDSPLLSFSLEELTEAEREDPSVLWERLEACEVKRVEDVGNLTDQLVKEKQERLQEWNEMTAKLKHLLDKKAEMEEDVDILQQNLRKEEMARQEESRNTNSMITGLKKSLNDAVELKSLLKETLQQTEKQLEEQCRAKEDEQWRNSQLVARNKELQQELDRKEQIVIEKESVIQSLQEDFDYKTTELNAALKLWKAETSELKDQRVAEVSSLKKRWEEEVGKLSDHLHKLQSLHQNTLNDLLLVGSKEGCVPVVCHTLKAGADVEVITNDGKGQQPLHLAARGGHLEVTRELLKMEANPTDMDYYGDQPIHIASRRGHQEVVKELLQCNSDLTISTDGEGWTAAQLATAKGHVKVLKVLYNHCKGTIMQRSPHNHTLLHYSTANNQLEASHWLLNMGVPCSTVERVLGFLCHGFWHFHLAKWLMMLGWSGLWCPMWVLIWCWPMRWLGQALGSLLRRRHQPMQNLDAAALKLKDGRQPRASVQDSKSREKHNEQLPPTTSTQPREEQQQQQQTETKHQQFVKKLIENERKLKEHSPRKQTSVPLASTAFTEGQKQTRKHQLPHGIPNLGNTCYMNSVLQCLFHTQPLTTYLTRSPTLSKNEINQFSEQKGEVARAYQKLCFALSSGRKIHDAVRQVKTTAGRFEPLFQGYEQKEAHDFLAFLLQWIDEDLGESTTTVEGRISEKSIVSELFHGVRRSVIYCPKTGKSLCSVDESFSNLSLAVIQQNSNLQDLLREHFREQNFEWDCDECRTTHQCGQRVTILTQPKILVVHLSRYNRHNPNGSKLAVRYPESDLTLEQFLTYPEDRARRYQLYALCDHHGTTKSGHYTAYCSRPWNHATPHWAYYSDTTVQPASSNDACSQHTAHILFYRSDNLTN